MAYEKLRISSPGLIPPKLWNQVIDVLERVTILKFEGGSLNVTKGGTILGAGRSSGGSGGETAAATHPFQLIDASERDESGEITTAKLRVVYGTIQGIAPSGFSDGDTPPFILDVASSGIVYGSITRDSTTGAITSRDVSSGAAIPDSSETEGYFEIGSFAVSGSSMFIGQAISGSQAYQFCGGDHLWGLV